MAREVRVFRSVDGVGRDALDSISDDAFYTYEWFKVLENQKSFPVSPYYLGVYDEDRLIAFTSCFIDFSDTYFFIGPRLRYALPFMKKLLTVGWRHGFCQDHVLLCYSPYSVRSRVLHEGNGEKRQVLSLLTQKIDEICRKERVLFSSFLFVSEFNDLLLKNLPNFNYLRSQGVTKYYMNVEWSSFEGYLQSLKKKTAQNVVREMKKCAENGVTIEQQEIKNFSAHDFSELNHNVSLKYDKNARNIFDSSFFRVLNEFANEKAVLFIAKKNAQVVGLCLVLRQGDSADVWMPGLDYDEMTRTDFTYFNVVYYAPIQWAIQEGVRKMNFSHKADKAKLRRGCKAEETFSFVKFHDELLGPLVNGLLNSPFCSLLGRKLPRRSW